MSNGSSSEDDCYGPALPPHLLQRQQEPAKPSIIGPCLPAGLKPPSHHDDDSSDDDGSATTHRKHTSRAEVLAEQVDEEEDDEEDDEVIGPLPPDHPLQLARAAAFDAAGAGKRGRDEDDVKPRREEWMLIPPKNKNVTELGLGPRKFLNRAPAQPTKDDGTAMDAAATSDEEFERETKEEMDQQIIDSYDKTMEAMISKSNGKRKAESLLEIHQRELKKKSQEAEKKEAKRKPFNRDTDLSVSGLTKEDSKKYVERSRELGGRFKQGRQKFL